MRFRREFKKRVLAVLLALLLMMPLSAFYEAASNSMSDHGETTLQDFSPADVYIDEGETFPQEEGGVPPDPDPTDEDYQASLCVMKMCHVRIQDSGVRE